MRISCFVLAGLGVFGACGLPVNLAPSLAPAIQGSAQLSRQVAEREAAERRHAAYAERVAAEQVAQAERARQQQAVAAAARARIAIEDTERAQLRRAALARAEEERQERLRSEQEANARQAAERLQQQAERAESERQREAERIERERRREEQRRFAFAVDVKPGTKREELIGKFVNVAAQVVRTDEQGAYFEFTETSEVCYRHQGPQNPTRWGRRGGGSSRSYRSSGSRRSGWSAWRARGGSRSYSSHGRRERGRSIIFVEDLDDPLGDIAMRGTAASSSTRKASQPRCHSVTTSTVLRLSHPENMPLQAGDYVRLFATALPLANDLSLVLANPTIKLVSRGEKVLIGSLD